jgi:hypothetical protein
MCCCPHLKDWISSDIWFGLGDIDCRPTPTIIN